MPRHPEPWYRSRDDAWYVQVRKKQVLLAKGKANKQQAYAALHRLMVQDGKTPAVDLEVADLCLLFKEWSRDNHAASTWEWYRGHLQSFIDHRGGLYGHLKVSEVTEHHLDNWLRGRKVGSSSRRGAITAVKRVFSWGVKKKRIAVNPIREMERPEMGRRRALAPSEVEAIFAAVPDRAFRDFLTALRLTGARPSEVARVSAAHVRGDVWVFEKHKTSGEIGKPRVVYMVGSVADLTRELVERYPSGPLFRNTEGNSWTRNAIRCRFRNLRKKLNLSRAA